MPYDKIASSIPDLCERCKKMQVLYVMQQWEGMMQQMEKSFNKMSKDEYVNTWSVLKSDMFKLKMDLFGKKEKNFVMQEHGAY